MHRISNNLILNAAYPRQMADNLFLPLVVRKTNQKVVFQQRI